METTWCNEQQWATMRMWNNIKQWKTIKKNENNTIQYNITRQRTIECGGRNWTSDSESEFPWLLVAASVLGTSAVSGPPGSEPDISSRPPVLRSELLSTRSEVTTLAPFCLHIRDLLTWIFVCLISEDENPHIEHVWRTNIRSGGHDLSSIC